MSGQLDRPQRLTAKNAPDWCLKALLANTKAESVLAELGPGEMAIARPIPSGLLIRFKRGLVRNIVHNAFAVTLQGEGGGTVVTVEETTWVSAGWWVPGLVALVFFGIVIGASERSAIAMLIVAGMAGVTELVALLFGPIVADSLLESDRERMAAFLGRVLEVSVDSTEGAANSSTSGSSIAEDRPPVGSPERS